MSAGCACTSCCRKAPGSTPRSIVEKASRRRGRSPTSAWFTKRMRLFVHAPARSSVVSTGNTLDATRCCNKESAERSLLPCTSPRPLCNSRLCRNSLSACSSLRNGTEACPFCATRRTNRLTLRVTRAKTHASISAAPAARSPVMPATSSPQPDQSRDQHAHVTSRQVSPKTFFQPDRILA